MVLNKTNKCFDNCHKRGVLIVKSGKTGYFNLRTSQLKKSPNIHR